MKAKSSGLNAASAAVYAKPCFYLGCTVVGANAATLKVWDSPTTTTSGDTEIDYIKCTTQKYNISHILEVPVWCAKGISGVITGTASYIIWYAY